MRVAYIGNLGEGSAPHSTENHVARALEANGVEVHRIHEQRFRWDAGEVPDVDFVLWTHTHGFAPERTHGRQLRFLDGLRARGIPSVGVHLDRWFDLAREPQLAEPFFRCDLVATADGGNDDRFAALGINHVWFPPGVSGPECEFGTYRDELASEVAFVGSWQGGYHQESRHRSELVEWLRATYGDRCRFWPAPGEHAVRGEALRDLYASVKVLVGDSCLVGTGRNAFYCSDRVPETVGRGGLLVHPDVEGVTDGTLYTSGEHLLTWPAYDWDALRDTIDRALADDELRRRVSTAGREHVLARHTYERRLADLLADLAERGLIKQEAAA
jgi:hypothetical protein